MLNCGCNWPNNNDEMIGSRIPRILVYAMALGVLGAATHRIVVVAGDPHHLGALRLQRVLAPGADLGGRGLGVSLTG